MARQGGIASRIADGTKPTRFGRAVGASLLAAAALVCAAPADARQVVRFSVSGDQPLSYPASIRYLPDEHTTIFPAIGAAPPRRAGESPGAFVFFVAMANRKGGAQFGDAFALQSRDLRRFAFAPGFGDPKHGGAIFWSPHPGVGNCAYRGVTHFDEQYAAPGSVLRDPTLPPGNFVMIYEAEIHCPAAAKGMAAGWVSIGVARSSDGGRHWPSPVARPGFETDRLDYGDGRYAGVTLPGVPPKAAPTAFFGDSLPSAFVDDMDPSGDVYLYVPYQFTGAPGAKADARIHMARAKLGDRSGGHERGRLRFLKWRAGGWSQPGLGGFEDGVTAPCASAYGEGGAQISYVDALHRYMMTFACTTYQCTPAGKCEPSRLSLFYSTAGSLARQDWSAPKLIDGSTRPYVADPKGGSIIDGGYPSFMSPGCKPGHLGLSGKAYFLKGDPLGERRFASRDFTMATDAPVARNGCAG